MVLAYDSGRVAKARELRMLLYIATFAIGLAGMLHAPWWAAMAGGCALALLFLLQDRRVILRGGDAANWEAAQTLSSLGVAVLASPLAFGAGRVTATLWGL